MLKRIFRAPLYATFFCALLLSACTSNRDLSETPCANPSHSISSVQGDGFKSPLLGQQVTVRGIVTLVQDDQGIYLEEANPDSDDRTSNAMFVQSAQPPENIAEGALIAVRGLVTELGEGRDTLTALTDVSAFSPCGSGQPLPSTEIKLPLDGSERESLEGMRIRIKGPLIATDVYPYGQGNITLSGNGIQFVPTETDDPGPATAGVITRNRNFALPVKMPEGPTLPGVMVSGASFDEITGVMVHEARGKRLWLQSMSGFNNAGFTPPAPANPGSLRIVGMNLHNYFNGDGKGSGFPTQRGAETVEGFEDQRVRIGAAIKLLDPQVVAVMELENDGFAADSAAQDFIRLIEAATGAQWAVARPVDDNTGTDKITVGIFYRNDQLKAIGSAHTLTGAEFKRSRQPQAQLFQRPGDDEKMLVVINHLKSKGSCPDSGEDADQKDGQGCWNPMRRSSAEKMSAWAKDVAAKAGTDNILILGDMNAYREEDPIRAIREAGFTELMDQNPAQKEQQRPYSFVYYGQHGTLDYAFASRNMLDKVQQAFIWHANAAMPGKMPGNTPFPRPWLRFSDHDTVVVDIF